jgi:hypothetical protein
VSSFFVEFASGFFLWLPQAKMSRDSGGHVIHGHPYDSAMGGGKRGGRGAAAPSHPEYYPAENTLKFVNWGLFLESLFEHNGMPFRTVTSGGRNYFPRNTVSLVTELFKDLTGGTCSILPCLVESLCSVEKPEHS